MKVIDRKKLKTVKRSTLKGKPTITAAWEEKYLCMNSLREKPVSDDVLERWGLELLQWAINEPKAIKMSQWLTLKGLDSKTLWRFCERNDKLKAAYNRALAILGDRREAGGLERKYDSGITIFMMPHYDPDWKAMVEWKAKMAKIDEQQNGGTKVVIVDRYVE